MAYPGWSWRVSENRRMLWLRAAAWSIAAVSYREEIRAMMKAGALDEED